MIPKLYQKDGTTLIGALTNCIECLVEEERNGIFEVTFQYPNTESIATSLVYDNIVICDANDTLKNQKFRIYDTRRMMNNTIEIYARHISFDLAYDYINSIDITNQSCEYALNTIFRSSQFSAGYVGHSNIVNAQNYKISNCNALEAIAGKEGSIIDTYGTGAEILRDNTDIHVLNRRGNDNGVSIEYAKNLTGFELQENTDDLITRIIPFATYTPEGGKQTRVQGTAVDSQYINNYSHPFIAEIDFSDKFKDNEVPTPAKLNTMAQRYFEENKCDLPKQNWKIEFIPLSKCVGYESIEDAISLCDTVTIRDTRYNIDTKAKVIKTVYDVLRERYDSMELGEPRTTLGDIVNTGSEKGEQGPPGPQGPKGEDGNIGDFPDSVPAKPVLTTTLLGFASIQLDWTYENKPYYWYEVYASKTKDFTPNLFDIVHKGQTSSFLFQAKPGETWYFRVCGVNSYDHRSEFSDQIEVITTKVDDLTNYFTTAAIGSAVVGSLTADYMTTWILKGNWIDAKNLSVTDGNGKRTLDIDSFGNVMIDATAVNVNSESISTISQREAANKIDSLVIGGKNLLKHTRLMTSATTGTGAEIQDTGTEGFRKIYIESTSTDTKQSNIPLYCPPGTLSSKITISFEYSQSEAGLLGVNLGTFDDNYNRVGEMAGNYTSADFKFLGERNGWPYASITFDPSGLNTGTYTQYAVQFKKLSGKTGTVQIRKPKLEFGEKPTDWTPAPEDVQTDISTVESIATTAQQTAEGFMQSVEAELQNNYYKKTEVDTNINGVTTTITQNLDNNYYKKAEINATIDNVTYNFQNSGTVNLLYNGNFSRGFDCWTNVGFSSSFGAMGHNVYSEGAFGENKYIYQVAYINDRIWDFTLSGYVYMSSTGEVGSTANHVKGLYAIVKFTDETLAYYNAYPQNYDTWEFVTINMHDLPKAVKNIEVYLYNKDTTKTLMYSKIMLNKGKTAMMYEPAAGEINALTTQIDSSGVNVIHSDGTRTNLNNNALDFYDKSSKKYASVKGGNYLFWNGDQLVGSLGHSAYTEAPDRHVSYISAEHGHQSVIAAKTTSDATHAQAFIVVAGHDSKPSDTKWNTGCTLFYPHTKTAFKFYHETTMEATPSLIMPFNNNYLGVEGYKGLKLGVMQGTTAYSVIEIDNTWGESPRGVIGVYSNIYMNGWSIREAGTTYSLTPQTSTYSLARLSADKEGTTSAYANDNWETYSTNSLTEHEIRWTDRENYYTTPDFDDETKYTCYVEIPYYMADNIEENYHVSITPISFGQYRVSERNPYYFIVESQEDNFTFTFEVVAKRLDTANKTNAVVANLQYQTDTVDNTNDAPII